MLFNTLFIEPCEQNEILQSKFSLRCNDMLCQLEPSKSVSMDELIWEIPFSHSTYKDCTAKLDFTAFEHQELMFVEKITVTIENGRTVELNPIGFAKWLLLEQNCSGSVDYRIVWYLERLKMLFAFLKEKQIVALEESDLEVFFTLLLTHDFSGSGFIRRLSIPAYGTRFQRLDLQSIYRTLQSNHIDLLLSRIDQNDQNKALNHACLVQANLTLAEYKNGGSFDFLGLDVGRHYVDFCAELFEDHISYATAARKSLKYIFNSLVTNGTKTSFKKVVVDTLMGVAEPEYQLSDIKRHYHKKLIERKIAIRKKTLTTFCQYYNEIVVTQKAFTLRVINSIAEKLSLPTTRFDTQEFIRAMLFTRFYDNNIKPRNAICEEYRASLAKDKVFPVDCDWGVSYFDRVCDELLQGYKISLDEVSNVCRNSIERLTLQKINSYSLNTVLNEVESAGVTCFVAYTGWRASEFGFSLSAISVAVNKDILDSVYTPFRFYVNWIVPKTSGKTPLEREITLSTHVLTQQLASLNSAGSSLPALVSKSFSNTVALSQMIAERVSRLWLDFPYKYQIFNDLDELEKYESIKTELTDNQKERYLSLKSEYDLNNSSVIALISLKNKLRKDSDVRALSKKSYRGKNGSTVRFAETLRRYRCGELDNKEEKLLNEILTEETKRAVLGDSFSFQIEAVSAVREEFIRDTLNATPHAFRHIWAEAVLRRYRGDIGRFIRANFKHMDERFFMAYLRNKELRSIYDVGKRTTINAVIRKHVRSMGDKKREFSGGLDRFISKAISITKVYSSQEFDKLVSSIADKRIIDIKVNPWATCLLRINTQHNAKCSIDGEPQRQNATPGFCLGCINGDIESGNFDGIVVYIRHDIDACRNPNLPFSFKRPHLETVNLALKRIKELNENSTDPRYGKFINYLIETIDITHQMKDKENGR
jgi:hypothetical protein